MYIELPVSPSRSITSPFLTSRSRNMSARRSKTGVPASPPKNDVLARNSLRAASAIRALYATERGLEAFHVKRGRLGSAEGWWVASSLRRARVHEGEELLPRLLF